MFKRVINLFNRLFAEKKRKSQIFIALYMEYTFKLGLYLAGHYLTRHDENQNGLKSQ